MSKQRLIDANALMETWNLGNATKYGNITEEDQAFSYDTMFMYEIADMIEDAPTIDPVKHGKWYTAEAYNGYLYWNCDQCHNHFTSQKSNYCPNCGAKMDKE